MKMESTVSRSEETRLSHRNPCYSSDAGNFAAGIAGKDLEVDSNLARDRETPYHRITFRTNKRSRAGCSGWKADHRISLAVQQQRFGSHDSNADYLNP